MRARDFVEKIYGSRWLPEDGEVYGFGLSALALNPEPNEPDGSWSGSWPVTAGAHVPLKGVNVAYLLCDDAGAVLYAGSTGSFRERMRAHIRAGKEWLRWTAEPCESRAAAYRRESELIAEYLPPLNVQAWIQGVAR